MNPAFEDMLIQMGITALRAALKDPTHAARVQGQLLEVASDIQIAYGLTPPTMPPAK